MHKFNSWTFLILWSVTAAVVTGDKQGPYFIQEPRHMVQFLNSSDAEVSCLASGKPSPQIHWVKRDGTPVAEIPGLRYIRPDGALMFRRFSASDYRQDVHTAEYKCVASNAVGSIISPAVRVRAVVSQPFEVRTYDEFLTRGNAAVFRCHFPSFAKDFLEVTAWIRDDDLIIHSGISEGKKYSVFPTGELYIRYTEQQDSFRTFKCQTRHRLTSAMYKSSTAGQLVLTEPHNIVAPRIIHRLTEVTARKEDRLVLPCVAQGYPVPKYRWIKMENGREVPITVGPRIILVDGNLVFQSTRVLDSGKYICIVNNTAHQEKMETDVTITSPLDVLITPSRLTTSIGHRARFNCSIQGFPVSSIGWMKDTKPIKGSDRRKIDRHELVIDLVKREDRGMYQCFVRNRMETVQATAELVLNDEPPFLEDTFKGTVHPVGSHVSLKCTATGNPLPQITWDLDGHDLPETLRHRVGDYVTRENRVVSYVNISSVRTEDGGLYKCSAANDVGTVQFSSRVNVEGPPVIRFMKNVTALSGNMLVIHCPFGGYPLPSITWEREGRKLPSGHRQVVHANGTLIVTEVNRKIDEGKYSCLAESKRGEKARRDVFVHVKVGPKIDPFKFNSHLEEGMRSVVVCSVLEGDTPISIRWLRNDDPIPDDLGAMIERLNNFTWTLTFHSVRQEHSGNYTCIANNSAAFANWTAEMTVKVAPYWKTQPTDRASILGESLTVNCQANGVPPPQIRWKKIIPGTPSEARTIISNPHIQILENGSLVIREIEMADAGEYMCQATNNIKPSLSTVIRIQVHVPAHFKKQFFSQNVPKGDSVTLRCEAFGEKPINISWKKDGQPFVADVRYEENTTVLEERVLSEIKVKSSDRRDSSLFNCIATNAYGRAETNFQVVVEENPDSPRNLNIKEVTSQSVSLTWMQPYSGNLPITHYIIQYKKDSEQWTADVPTIRNSPNDHTVTVRSLSPATTYNFRVIAENARGHGNPSEVVSVITKEEAPTSPPVGIEIHPAGSGSLIVRWKSPPREYSKSPVKGYYLGYKKNKTGENYVYNTLDASRQRGREEFRLNNLEKNTYYAIRLQAFNTAGPGPASEDVVAKTLEHDRRINL